MKNTLMHILFMHMQICIITRCSRQWNRQKCGQTLRKAASVGARQAIHYISALVRFPFCCPGIETYAAGFQPSESIALSLSLSPSPWGPPSAAAGGKKRTTLGPFLAARRRCKKKRRKKERRRHPIYLSPLSLSCRADPVPHFPGITSLCFTELWFARKRARDERKMPARRAIYTYNSLAAFRVEQRSDAGSSRRCARPLLVSRINLCDKYLAANYICLSLYIRRHHLNYCLFEARTLTKRTSSWNYYYYKKGQQQQQQKAAQKKKFKGEINRM